MDTLQRRFDELLSVLAILGPDHCTVEVGRPTQGHAMSHTDRKCGLSCSPPPPACHRLQALDPPELFAAVLQGEYDCSSCQHLAEQPTQLTLLLHPPGVPPARLHLRLPPAYPGSAAATVTAVTCDALGRQWEQHALQQLQAVAAEAPDECLFQLTEALAALLQQGRQAASAQLGRQHDHEPTATAQQAQPAAAQQVQQQQMQQQAQQTHSQQHPDADSGRQLALLKLDHMHSRGSYSRLIRRWACELGLSGRLLFCGSSPIILILLLGAAGDIKEFLLRMRTRNVDVDSKGRYGASAAAGVPPGGRQPALLRCGPRAPTALLACSRRASCWR